MESNTLMVGGGCNCRSNPCMHSGLSGHAMAATSRKKPKKDGAAAAKKAKEAAKKAARFNQGR